MAYLFLTPEESGQRLDRWIQHKWPHIPYVAIQAAVRKGDIRVDGKKVPASFRLLEKHSVRLYEGWLETFSRPIAGSVPISPLWRDRIESWTLYEDEELLALNKPQGLATQGGTYQRISVDALVRPYRLVHRLDKETSGILLIAKTLRCAQHLAEAFKQRQIKKIYWAIVHGPLPKRKGVITIPLSDKRTGDFLEASTSYEQQRILRHRPYLWVQLSPETGRMHQLRLHMAGIGCPVVGDKKYGYAGDSYRLQLHCRAICLPCGRWIEAPPPNDSLFQECMPE